jgi:hypothetical protein
MLVSANRKSSRKRSNKSSRKRSNKSSRRRSNKSSRRRSNKSPRRRSNKSSRRRSNKSSRKRSNKSSRRRSTGKPVPINTKLYDRVKLSANKKFKSPSGIYRSSWIVKEYKKRGGKYSGKKDSKSGISRWFKEKWIDLNKPIKNSRGKVLGYKKCGSSKKNKDGKYPLCRPSKRINNKTPKTYRQLSKVSLRKAKKDKVSSKSIKFSSF